jgi:hypothetical protein
MNATANGVRVSQVIESSLARYSRVVLKVFFQGMEHVPQQLSTVRSDMTTKYTPGNDDRDFLINKNEGITDCYIDFAGMLREITDVYNFVGARTVFNPRNKMQQPELRISLKRDMAIGTDHECNYEITDQDFLGRMTWLEMVEGQLVIYRFTDKYGQGQNQVLIIELQRCRLNTGSSVTFKHKLELNDIQGLRLMKRV